MAEDLQSLESQLVNLTQALKGVQRAIQIASPGGEQPDPQNLIELKNLEQTYLIEIAALQEQITSVRATGEASGGTNNSGDTAASGGASAADPANADTAAGGSIAAGEPLGQPGEVTVTAIPGTAAGIASGTAGQVASPDNNVTTAGSPQTAGSNDDSSPTMSETMQKAASSTSQGIGAGPMPNPLDKYPSYSYSLGLYLLTPQDYNRFVEADSLSETIALPGDQLLIRTGGGPTDSANRNPYFSDCDFSLDNLKIESVIGFSEQGVPSSLGKLSFTVTEPAGATFITRLQYATSELGRKDPNSAQQYYAHTYALVIRFYGYDNNGNPITPKGNINQIDLAGSSESAALTKIFFFMLADVKTRIGTKIVEYYCSGIFGPTFVARTAMLGVSPARFELTGTNLDDIFNGIPGTSNTSSQADDPRAGNTEGETGAGAKTSAQPSQNIPTRGLCQALNEELKRLLTPKGQGTKTVEIPDEYEVKFASETLRGAKVIIPNVDNSLKNAAGTVPSETKTENVRKNTSVPKNAKNFVILPGTPIIQWMDFMIRNSEYVKGQAAFKITEKTADADIQGEEDFYGEKTSTKPVKWYKITPFNKILGYDKLRKTYANKITYVISEYGVVDVRSPYFKRAPWRGPDKLYNFTFTGQNRSIINYEQDFNALYRVTFGAGAQLANDPAKVEASKAGQVTPSFAYRVVAEASKQGSQGDSTDPSARAAAGIYSFTDLAKVKIKIVGDPDLLLQDWYNVNQALLNRKTTTQAAGGNDSNLLNSNFGELYFQVTFLTGDDWNLNEGIAKIEPRLGFVRKVSNAYRFTRINSEFQNGRFTQDIEGLILADVNPDQAFIKGDYTTGAASQIRSGVTGDSTTETDSTAARQDYNTQTANDGVNTVDGDLRTQEGGASSVPQSPTGATPAPGAPFSSPLADRLRELGVQRAEFRRGLLPNEAQTGSDDAPPTVYGTSLGE